MSIEVTVTGSTSPQVSVGANGNAAVNVPSVSGVVALNGLAGSVTLAAVGATIGVAGQTITLTVAPGVTSWNDLTDKPATFPPSSHTHTASAITDFNAAVVAAAPPTTNASLLTSGTLADARLSANVVLTVDSRLSDSREWSAATVTQADAEAGVATVRVAWTVQRVWQAIAAWWAASSAKTKLDGIADGATANQTDAYLLARTNHTGTQSYTTITGLGTLATQSGTFSGTSSGTNTGDQTITLTGDVTGSGTGSFAATLANTAVTAGSYGSASSVGTFTVDGKGRLTAAGSTSIAIAAGAVSGLAAVATSGAYSSLSGIPSSFTPSAHKATHATGGSDALTYSDVGAQKPITVSSSAPTGGANGDIWLQTAAAGQVTPATITADQNDYAPGAGDIYRISSNAARSITGWTAWSDGSIKLLVNVGSFAITLKHQSTSSSANNRFITPWAGDFVLGANGGSAIMFWDATDSRVRVI